MTVIVNEEKILKDFCKWLNISEKEVDIYLNTQKFKYDDESFSY